jgi:hypothetical protein
MPYNLGFIRWFGTGSAPSGGFPTSGVLEPYPLDFRVVSAQQLQTHIQQYKQRGTNYNISFSGPITQITGAGVVAALIAVVGYLWHRGKK